MTDKTQACIPEQCYKQIQADTVQQARQQHHCRSGVERPPCLYLPHRLSTHTQVHTYTADVYSSQRWDRANHPLIVPLISNNRKGPDSSTKQSSLVCIFCLCYAMK